MGKIWFCCTCSTRHFTMHYAHAVKTGHFTVISKKQRNKRFWKRCFLFLCEVMYFLYRCSVGRKPATYNSTHSTSYCKTLLFIWNILIEKVFRCNAFDCSWQMTFNLKSVLFSPLWWNLISAKSIFISSKLKYFLAQKLITY